MCRSPSLGNNYISHKPPHYRFEPAKSKYCCSRVTDLRTTFANTDRVPYLYEEAYQWYESFDSLGELLARPNPTHILDLLENLLRHLTLECHWRANGIHLFGFGQGGSVAVELGLRWWKAQGTQNPEARLGSIVSVAGPLLSYPTPLTPCPTPVLVFYRPRSATTKLSAGDLTALKKGYEGVQEVQSSNGDGMPRSKEDWEPVMRFWSAILSRRNSSGLYEIIGGGR
jgi:pimeloyl-ACP methyl ester carboxylesterase